MDASSADLGRAARVIGVVGQLIRRIRDEARAASGLSTTQEWAVDILRDTPGLTSAELARAQGVSAQTMNAAIKALTAAGYITASEDQTDGRRRNLTVTTLGLEAVQHSQRVKQEWIVRSLAHVAEPDLDALDRALNVLLRLAREP